MPRYFTQSPKRVKRFLGLFLSIVVLGLLGCSSEENSNIELWKMAKDCDLHTQTCTATKGDQQVSLKIAPNPIPIARPLGIEVEVKNLKPTEMQLDISGINMYMGYNRVRLSSKKPDHWIGTSMLAFCTTEKMEWQITVMMHENGKEIQVPFYLETSNRGN